MSLASHRHLRLPAVLALLLIGVWVGIGLVHEHTGAPTCQVCNVLQSTTADLVAPVVVGESIAVVILPAPPTLTPVTAHHPSTPPGRAPPLA